VQTLGSEKRGTIAEASQKPQAKVSTEKKERNIPAFCDCDGRGRDSWYVRDQQ